MRYWRISALFCVLSAPALAHTAHHAASLGHHAKKTVAHHSHHGKSPRHKVAHGPSEKSVHHAAVTHHTTHAHAAHHGLAHKLAGPSTPADHSADDLNGRSLDAAQSGQPYSATPQ